MASGQKTASGASAGTKQTKSLNAKPDEFLRLKPPEVPQMLDNVLLVFTKSIPQDAYPQCEIDATKMKFDKNASESAKRAFLLEFVRERLEMVARQEYGLWLNGRLPFITPRELLVWRLRQYVEYIWAFQLPENDDLSVIFNTTKLRAAGVASDFLARFRKALLFPIALRRLYLILRGQDPVYTMLDKVYEQNKAYGTTFLVPSRRYQEDANALIDEFRLREDVPLKDAQLINKTDNVLWIHKHVLDIVKDDDIYQELLGIYIIPQKAGYEG